MVSKSPVNNFRSSLQVPDGFLLQNIFLGHSSVLGVVGSQMLNRKVSEQPIAIQIKRQITSPRSRGTLIWNLKDLVLIQRENTCVWTRCTKTNSTDDQQQKYFLLVVGETPRISPSLKVSKDGERTVNILITYLTWSSLMNPISWITFRVGLESFSCWFRENTKGLAVPATTVLSECMLVYGCHHREIGQWRYRDFPGCFQRGRRLPPAVSWSNLQV